MKSFTLPTIAVLATLILAGGCKKKSPVDPDPTPAPTPIPIPTPTPDMSGINWTQAAVPAFSGRAHHTTLTFEGKLWVIGGQDGSRKNDVWSSVDGQTWVQVTAAAAFSARDGHSSVVFDDGGGEKMWVIGGDDGIYKNDVWSSDDGVTWVQATAAAAFSGRETQSSMVFNSKMWVIAGYDVATKNDVWSSVDGVTWVQATAAAAFPARWEQCGLTHNSKMWILAGEGAVKLTDAWSSVDGVTWVQATAAAGFLGKEMPSCVTFNSRMWIMAGDEDIDGYTNDVWSSLDGASWVEVNSNASFAKSQDRQAVVFNNKMWLIGGQYAGYNNEVWYSP